MLTLLSLIKWNLLYLGITQEMHIEWSQVVTLYTTIGWYDHTFEYAYVTNTMYQTQR